MPQASADGGAAAAAAARPREVVGIARRAEDRVERLRSGAELRRVGLAEGDRAGGANPRDDGRVLRRHVIAVEGRAPGRANAGRVHEIFVRHGQAVQHADRPAARDDLVGTRRVGHRPLGHERDDRVDLRVDALDLRQVRGHHLARRNLLRAQQRGEFDRAEERDLIVHLTGLASTRCPPLDYERRACPPSRRRGNYSIDRYSRNG